MRISDWSSDVCSSDLHAVVQRGDGLVEQRQYQPVLEVPGHLVVLRHLGLLRLALGPGVQALAVLLAALARLGWGGQRGRDRKSTRLNPVTNAHLVCRLLLEKQNIKQPQRGTQRSHRLQSENTK